MSKSNSTDSHVLKKDSEEIKISTRDELAQKVADAHENLLSYNQVIVVFLAMATALLLSFVDQTSITVTLPFMARDLNAEQTASWAGTASLISNTVFMVLFGRFSDIFSRKYTMIASMLILAISDLACGLAQTPAQLYVFRGFCGIGNGGITSLTMVIVSDIVSLEDRGKFQGILGACVGLGNAIGPFIASAFITHSNWRKLYYTLFAIITPATLVIFFLVPYTKPENSTLEKIKSLDYFGFLSSSIAIIFILVPVSGGGSTYAWNSALVISMLVTGSVSFLVFLFVEHKIATLPLIPLKLFYNNVSLFVLLSQNLFFGICYYSAIYYYPYYFEIVREYSVIKTSCFFLALVLPQSFVSVGGGQIISRTKHYWHVIWFGYTMWMISMGLLNLWSVSNNKAINVITMILNGLGIGCIFQPTLVAAQAQSYKRDRATIISTRNVLRSFGGAVGLAICTTILANTFRRNLLNSGEMYFTTDQIEYLNTQIYTKIDLAKYSSVQTDFLRSLYMQSIKSIFYVWMGCMTYCFVSNIFVKDKGLRPLDDRD